MQSSMHFVLKILGKRKLLHLGSATLITTVLDLAGIAIILPYLQIISNPASRSFTLLVKAIGLIGVRNPTNIQATLWASAALIIFFVVKYFTTILMTAYQNRIYANNTYNVTNTLYDMLMSSEYQIFHNNSGSELVGITYHSSHHATLCLQSIMTAVNEFAVLGILILSLVAIRPMETMIAISTIGLIGFATYRVAIKRVARYGVIQQQMDIVRQRLSFATANSIKDIKIMGLEPLFTRKNLEIAANYREITWRYQLLANFPRLTIEHLFMVLFVVGTTGFLLLGMPVEQLLPTLGMIGLIAMRAIPGLSKIINAHNSYRYSEANMIRIQGLYRLLTDHAHHDRDVSLPFTHAITLSDVTFCYGQRQILVSLNMRFEKGRSVGIVGPSGSGKSTLLDVLTGIQQAQSGQILLDDQAIDPFGSNVLKRKIGYVPQHITLLDDTIAFNITFATQYDPERLHEAIRAASLETFVASLPDGLNTYVGENGVKLSGGQKQRIGIARALYRQPEILLFDEATSALDNITERELSAEIERLSDTMTVIQVAHRLSTIEHCDVIYVMEQGRVIASGDHATLLRNCQLYATMCNSQHD